MAAGPDVRAGQLRPARCSGLPQQQFLQDPNQALYCIVAMTVWGWLGFDVIVYLAALQGIPEDLLEAAEIDGASRWSRFRTIVVPLLSPATLFLVVWSTINALQLFDEIYVTTRGGPLGVDHGGRLLPLPAGISVLQRRLRLGDRLRAVRRRS